jgi:hypothetical protein
MSADNVTPIRPKAAQKPPRRTRRKVENFTEIPSNMRLVQALHGVCEAAEASAESSGDQDLQIGLCTAAEILSKMLWESLTNTGVI